MRRLCLGLLCAVLLAGATIGMTSSVLKSNPLEPETNVDGYEFPEQELLYNQRTDEGEEDIALFYLTIRLTEAEHGAAERGFACFGFFELVLRNSRHEQIDTFSINSCFNNQPIGFENAGFPSYNREDKERGNFLITNNVPSGWIFAIGQKSCEAPEGYRAYIPFFVGKKGALSKLPIEGEYIYAPENPLREDYVPDRLRGYSPAPNGDFCNFYGPIPNGTLQIGRFRSMSEFVPETDYLWDGERYCTRRSDYDLRPYEGFGSVPLKTRTLTLPMMDAVGESPERQIIYAGIPEADYFYTERDAYRDEMETHHTSIYLVKDGKARRLASYEGVGWLYLDAVLFDGRYLYWEVRIDFGTSPVKERQRYDSKTGKIENCRERYYWSEGGFAMGGPKVSAPQDVSWTVTEMETGRTISIFSVVGDWRTNSAPSSVWKGTTAMLYQRGQYSEQKLCLLDLNSGEFTASYSFETPDRIPVDVLAISSRYALLSSGVFRNRDRVFFLDLRSGEQKTIWDSPKSPIRSARFLTEDCFAFLNEDGRLAYYDISDEELKYSSPYIGERHFSLTRAYDGKTLLAYSEDGSRVVAFTPA